MSKNELIRKRIFNYLASVNIYFNADIEFKKEARRDFRNFKNFLIRNKDNEEVLKYIKKVKEFEENSLEEVPNFAVVSIINNIIFEVGEEMGYNESTDVYGARYLEKEIGIRKIMGETNGQFAYYDSYEELVKELA